MDLEDLINGFACRFKKEGKKEEEEEEDRNTLMKSLIYSPRVHHEREEELWMWRHR